MTTKNGWPDRIAEMFEGSTILITGGTGFIGQAIIEKFLRLTNVKKIYILIRNKKGKTPPEICKEMMKAKIFEIVRKNKPEALAKCEAISGDVIAPDLAISESDRKKLAEEVDFIYHSAATTRFDDTMKYAVMVNTRGTKLMLDLGQECKHLKCFVHISTAYAFPDEPVLYEKAYSPPANPHDVLKSISWIKEDSAGIVTKALLGDCPNTYTFTKAMAEALVVEKMNQMPVIIVRPSVVIPALNEPIPGWSKSMQGPMGLLVGAGKGMIRTMYLNNTSHVDFLPVDMVVNGAFVSTWDYVVTKERRFFNFCSGDCYKISWGGIIEIGKRVINERVPFNGIVWYPGGSTKTSKLHHNICFNLYQVLPAIVIDAVISLVGYKPLMYKLQKRIQKGNEMFEYYTWKAWQFDNTQVRSIRERMNEGERKLYKIDGEGFDIMDYFTEAVLYIRRNILKETDDMLPAARRNMKIMWCLDVVVKGLLFLGLLYYMCKLIFP